MSWQVLREDPAGVVENSLLRGARVAPQWDLEILKSILVPSLHFDLCPLSPSKIRESLSQKHSFCFLCVCSLSSLLLCTEYPVMVIAGVICLFIPQWRKNVRIICESNLV